MLVAKAQKGDILLEIHQEENPIHPREFDNIGTIVTWHRRYDIGDEHNYDTPYEFLRSLAEEVAEEELYKRAKEKLELKQCFDENGEYWQVIHEGEVWVEVDTYEEAKEEQDYLAEDVELTSDELMDIITDHAVILPVYIYDHSGVTIRTTPFNDPWDSGQIGWIYATHERLRKETRYNDDELFKQGKAEEILKAEIEELDTYLRGDVYGFVVKRVVECETCGQKKEEVLESYWGFYGSDFETNGMKDDLGEYAHLLDELEYV